MAYIKENTPLNTLETVLEQLLIAWYGKKPQEKKDTRKKNRKKLHRIETVKFGGQTMRLI